MEQFLIDIFGTKIYIDFLWVSTRLPASTLLLVDISNAK